MSKLYSKLILCSCLIVALFLGKVYGRRLQTRQAPGWNQPSNYPNRNGYNQLYPTLDFTNPNQIDPGFSPYYHQRRNGTYIPNFNFGNGNSNANRYPNNYPNRYPNNNANRYPNNNRFPNGNYTNVNVHNQQGGELPANLIAQSSLPSPRSTCGKPLCAYVANYPTRDIGNAVDRARDALRSGRASATLRNRGITLDTLKSKTVSTGGYNQPSSCKTNTNTVYPHEGFSSDDNQAYYVVNVPSLGQGVNAIECDRGNYMACRTGGASLGIQECQQAYRREQLLVVPIGKRYIDVDDFQLKTFYVPAGCYCLWSIRPPF